MDTSTLAKIANIFLALILVISIINDWRSKRKRKSEKYRVWIQTKDVDHTLYEESLLDTLSHLMYYYFKPLFYIEITNGDKVILKNSEHNKTVSEIESLIIKHLKEGSIIEVKNSADKKVSIRVKKNS